MSLRRALFLDRDGVLNVDTGYLHRWEDWRWVDGALQVLAAATRAGWLTVVVTNQSGVARGYYGEPEVEAVHARMTAAAADAGARIDAVYYACHHPNAVEDRWRHPDHPDVKPNPGMLLRAIAEHGIDPARSVLIGDRDRDVQAAERAGVRGLLFEPDRWHGDLAAFVRAQDPALELPRPASG